MSLFAITRAKSTGACEELGLRGYVSIHNIKYHRISRPLLAPFSLFFLTNDFGLTENGILNQMVKIRYDIPDRIRVGIDVLVNKLLRECNRELYQRGECSE